MEWERHPFCKTLNTKHAHGNHLPPDPFALANEMCYSAKISRPQDRDKGQTMTPPFLEMSVHALTQRQGPALTVGGGVPRGSGPQVHGHGAVAAPESVRMPCLCKCPSRFQFHYEEPNIKVTKDPQTSKMFILCCCTKLFVNCLSSFNIK